MSYEAYFLGRRHGRRCALKRLNGQLGFDFRDWEQALAHLKVLLADYEKMAREYDE